MLGASVRLGVLAAVALLALAVAAGGWAAPPSNDDYAQPIVVSGSEGTIVGSNADATVQADEPANDYGWSNQTVWYAWTAPWDGHVSFEADAEPWISHVCVYTGATAAEATMLMCADTGVELDVTAGTTYHISVDGFDFWGAGVSSGDFYFVWNFSGSTAPANDNWAYAAQITGASGSVSGTTAGATLEPGEPASIGTQTVWYHWIAPQDGIVSFSADASVVAYTGTSLAALTPAGSGGTAATAQGDVLSIAVDGNGPFALTWRTAPAPEPVLTVPADITVDANSPAGASVSYDVAAVDWKGRSLTPTCSKGSGYAFPIGTTTVICEATDVGGRSTTASFDVHVNGVPEQLTALDGRVAAAQLDPKLADKLRGKLAAAQKHFAGGRMTAACSAINGFLETVDENSGTAIPLVQADAFRQDAWRIRAVLNCA